MRFWIDLSIGTHNMKIEVNIAVIKLSLIIFNLGFFKNALPINLNYQTLVLIQNNNIKFI